MQQPVSRVRRIMRFSLILLLVLFALPLPAHSEWTSGGPAGGDVTCMIRSVSHSAIIYAGTKSGIWKSVDSGETWAKTSFPDTEVLNIQVVPDNPEIVYAGTTHTYAAGGILKSVDGGLSWSLMGIAGQDVNAIAIDPEHTDTIYAGTGSWENAWPEEVIGIYKSTNGGDDWSLTISFGGTDEPVMRKITTIVVDPDDSATVYAGGHNYGVPVFAAFLVSTDGGDTWTDKAFKGSWQYIGGLAITPQGYLPKTLFATLGDDPSPGQFNMFCTSTDGGTTWSVWSAAFTPALTVNPANADLVYIGSGSAGVPLWIFNHRSQLWIPFFSDGLPATSPTSIVMNPSEETYFCTGFISAGIYKVRSSGDWYPTRLNATNILDIAVRPESSNTVVAAIEGYRRLAISTDGGSSWGELVNSPTNRSAVTYDPQNPDRLYAGFGWEDRSSTTYRLDMSTDGGLNWASTGPMFYVSGNISMGVTDIWIHPDNAQKIIVTVGSPYGGVYLSNNGGTTWTDHPLEFWASSIVSDPNDPDRLFYGTFHQGYVCYSENGGYLWTDISPGVDTFWEVRDIVVGADAIAYTATDVGLWTWDGFSWAKINGLPSEDMTTLVIGRSSDSEILYVGTGDSGVFVSDNGGSSWDEFNSGLGNMSINRLSISDTSPKRLYAGTSHGSVWQYDFSVDACEGDFDKDGDIDGKDLSAFISDNKGILLLEFSSKFGGTQCD